MKQILKYCSTVLLTSACLNGSLPPSPVTPLYTVRSQGVDAARELSGWSQHVNLFDKECVYGTAALTVEYAQSFRPNLIAQSLFGTTASCANDCSDYSFNVSGSRVSNRGANDWFADYFYLPTDFESSLNFSPRIQNVVVDINFYVGLDNFAEGLFFRLDLPINWTNWNLGFCELITATGGNNYDAGYFNSFDVAPTGGNIEGIGIERSNLLNSFSAYAQGGVAKDTTGTVFNQLCYAKIGNCSQSVTALADVQMILGWNFLSCEDYHFGLGLLARAPTGNKPNAEYLFEPIVGNGGHWELGAHITTHANLWRCEQEQKSLGFYLDANITYMFNAKQRRTFDLCDKPLSRYMLAEKLDTPVTDLAGGTTIGANIPSAQFVNQFTPVANLTTQEVKVSIGVQGDLAAQFTYVTGNWNWDVGYNFWGRSCEKICLDNCQTNSLCCQTSCNTTCNTACNDVAFAANTWALKGDAYVYGFVSVDNAVPLSATESQATIYAGTTFPTTGATQSWQNDNDNVDNPQLAFAGLTTDELYADPAAANNQTNTSVNPVFIQASDFNYVGTRGLSNKLYTNLSYSWDDCDTYTPYFGIGVYGEFGSSNNCNLNCTTNCGTTNACNTTCPTNCASSCSTNNCLNSSLSQWGIWVKMGTDFN